MSYYDEIDLEDLTYAPASTPQLTLYTYPCPCGDRFEISLLELREGGEVAVCPGCSLRVLVVGVVVVSFFSSSFFLGGGGAGLCFLCGGWWGRSGVVEWEREIVRADGVFLVGGFACVGE